MDKEHLYYFTNMSDYETFKTGENYVTPNVCFILDYHEYSIEIAKNQAKKLIFPCIYRLFTCPF